MSLAVVLTRANIGIEAPIVRVEAHLSNGLPGFTIVGLPETAVKESKERVRSALLNSQLDFPDKRITINLAPPLFGRSAGARLLDFPDKRITINLAPLPVSYL